MKYDTYTYVFTAFHGNNSCIASNKQQQEMQIKKTHKVVETYRMLLGNRNLAVERSAKKREALNSNSRKSYQRDCFFPGI